jgi:DNA-binding winged helix-turn-helix (wHTH) protein
MSRIARFDCFEVNFASGELRKHGIRIHLREQSFHALALLLERRGEIVTRDDLRWRRWPTDVFVDFENNLNNVIARLREALGDSADQPRFVENAAQARLPVHRAGARRAHP